MKDVFGKALLDYQNGNYSVDIVTSTSISEDDILPIPHLFRNFDNMPRIEQKALELANGTILDIGCGAGNHSLYLQDKGFIVKGIDISEGAISVCKERGLKNVEVLNFINESETYDTILLLMNGSGVFQTLAQTPYFLNHLKNLLNINGQILIDSSDIKYMYETDDGGLWLDLNSAYYGELDYTVKYKDEEESFPWMYLDFANLKLCCEKVGLKCELILEGEHHDFLAKITA
jgi:cyclopropane fatty-acyl-phospholipid synthase-like methyltransferase